MGIQKRKEKIKTMLIGLISAKTNLIELESDIDTLLSDLNVDTNIFDKIIKLSAITSKFYDKNKKTLETIKSNLIKLTGAEKKAEGELFIQFFRLYNSLLICGRDIEKERKHKTGVLVNTSVSKDIVDKSNLYAYSFIEEYPISFEKLMEVDEESDPDSTMVFAVDDVKPILLLFIKTYCSKISEAIVKIKELN